MWQWGRLVARIVGDEGDAGAGVREQHRLARIDMAQRGRSASRELRLGTTPIWRDIGS